MLGKSASGGLHHGVGDAACARGYDAEPDGGENVDVVALRDGDLPACVAHRGERRTRREQGAAFGPANQVPGLGFGFFGGIGERQDDGPRNFSRHLANNRFGEGAGNGGESDENAGVDLGDYVGERNLPAGVGRPIGEALRGLRVHPLLSGEIRAAGVQETFAIHNPEAPARVALGKAFGLKRVAKIIGHADGGRAGAEENNLLIRKARAANFHGAQNRAKRYSGGALDVVVEGEKIIAVALEDGPRMRTREVFPLQARFGQLLFHGLHELVNEIEIRLSSDPFMPPAKILRILQALRIVGSNVQHNGQSARGMNAADESVERKLSDGDAQTADALISDAQNAFAIGDHDDERILGIGDQGVGGLGIPIGKLSLYTLIGGVPPVQTLPVILDVGTNNEERLADPEYLGWRHERITGDAYDDFVDRFVQAVKQELPETLLQWEDFATPHARPILDRYRNQLVTFNDDIQGTAAVAVGAILSAVRVSGRQLRDQQIVMLGAGSAGTGVADFLRAALVAEGLPEAEARSRFWLVDIDGLLHSQRTDLSAEQRTYARPGARVANFP